MVTYELLRRIIVPLASRKIRAVEGLEHLPRKGGCIIAANHVSWFDPVYLTAAMHRAVQRRLLFLAATGKYRWSGAALPIDPNDKSRCLLDALEYLKLGHWIAIFPQGNVGERGSFHTGAARLSYLSGCPIIPAGLVNVPRGHVVASVLGTLFGVKNVHVRFGDPITATALSEPPKLFYQERMERVHRAIRQLSAEAL